MKFARWFTTTRRESFSCAFSFSSWRAASGGTINTASGIYQRRSPSLARGFAPVIRSGRLMGPSFCHEPPRQTFIPSRALIIRFSLFLRHCTAHCCKIRPTRLSCHVSRKWRGYSLFQLFFYDLVVYGRSRGRRDFRVTSLIKSSRGTKSALSSTSRRVSRAADTPLGSTYVHSIGPPTSKNRKTESPL